MVSRPRQSAGNCWRAISSILLGAAFVVATSMAATAGSGTTAKASGELPFGLSALFGRNQDTSTSKQRTRVTIDLRHTSRFEVFSLNNPNRVIIQLPQVGMRLPVLRRSSSNGLVKGLRAGQAAPGQSRIIIDVEEPVVIANTRMKPSPSGRGAQLEIDLLPFEAPSRGQRAALQRPTYSLGGPLAQPPIPRPALSRSARTAYKPLIVIDPGHGGKDSGAQKFGVNEKDVVLAFSLTLRKRLLKTNRYRVKMTRSRDVFISLGERRKFAEDNTAALFIAVHADYAGSSARGATIYSLRKALANKLRVSAAAEAASDAMSGNVMRNITAKSSDLTAVRGILGDLAQREVHANLERTNSFTKIAISQMGATTTMRSKPHRQAAFKVLKTAKVPSVLIELAYVSNRRDAARLQSQSWRNEVSGSLVSAIDKYFAQSLSQIAQ